MWKYKIATALSEKSDQFYDPMQWIIFVVEVVKCKIMLMRYQIYSYTTHAHIHFTPLVEAMFISNGNSYSNTTRNHCDAYLWAFSMLCMASHKNCADDSIILHAFCHWWFYNTMLIILISVLCGFSVGFFTPSLSLSLFLSMHSLQKHQS